MKSYFYLLFACALLWNCDGRKVDIIELKKGENVKISLETSSEIIQLETSAESTLQYIFKTFVDLTNDRIFVLSNFNIYFFEANGKYLDKLKIGKGPGEILQVVAFTVDVEKKLIYVIDNSINLCLFDYFGKMIKRYDISSFASTDLCILDDENVFLLRNFVGAEEDKFIGIYNTSTQKVVKKFIDSKESPYSTCSLATLNNFSHNNGKFFLNIPNIFSLFEFKDENLGFQPILSFDIGKSIVPKRLSSKFEKGKYCDLRDEAKSFNLIPFQLFGFKFKEHFFIVLDDKDLSCYAINDKNKKIYLNGTLPSYFNLPDKKSFKLLTGIQNNMLIFQGNPFEFFESKSQEDTMEININSNKFTIHRMDNPFLVIVR